MWLGRPTNEVTWEPASKLNNKLIADYENDVVASALTTKSNEYGSLLSTITVSKADKQTKKQKMDRPLVDKVTGYVPHLSQAFN